MSRSSLLWLAVLISSFVGCQRTPSRNNLFSAFGATRIPPPGTGTYQHPSNYYRESPRASQRAGWNSAAALATRKQPIQDDSLVRTRIRGSKEDVDLTPAGSRVSRADHKESASHIRNEVVSNPTTRVVDRRSRRAGSTRTGLNLRGMPVNDATSVRSSGRIRGDDRLQDISGLPPAPTTRVRRSASFNSRTARSRGSSPSFATDWRSRGGVGSLR